MKFTLNWPMNIEIAGGPSAGLEAVQELWVEYWDALGLPQSFQNFAEEWRSLPGVYAPPRGCLLLARIDGEPAGTAGFRPLPERVDSCEAKRLYVRPAFRGQGVARALLARLIQEARKQGYRELYGDTLSSMEAALQLYNQLGFVEVGPYSLNPTAGATYLRLSL